MSTCSCSSTVSVTPKVSVLANDYSGLVNLPTINGVTLAGDLTSKELNLLSPVADDYDMVTLTAAQESDGYILVLLPEENEAAKVNLGELISQVSLSEGNTSTAEVLNENAAVGSYQYVLIDE